MSPADPIEVGRHPRQIKVNHDAGALYGLGVLGAAVYYIQGAAGFWAGALGLLKAFFWPALLVYKVFDTLKL